MRGYKIVSIEGCDGSGKTTVAKAITSEMPEYCYIHFPTHDTEAGKLIHEHLSGKITLAERLLDEAFLVDMALAFNKYDKIHTHFVVDRYIHSYIVYRQILGNSSEEVLRNRLYGYGLTLPKVTIYLRAELDVLRNRLLSRPDKNVYDVNEELMERTLALYDTLWKKGEIIAVDASKPIDEVVAVCKSILQTA